LTIQVEKTQKTNWGLFLYIILKWVCLYIYLEI
jgi:hypothetical protein